jgi:hypothetical protein
VTPTLNYATLYRSLFTIINFNIGKPNDYSTSSTLQSCVSLNLCQCVLYWGTSAPSSRAGREEARIYAVLSNVRPLAIPSLHLGLSLY